MHTYQKWCAFGLVQIALFAGIMLISEAFGNDAKMIMRVANMAWFFPLNMWSFDRQLKEEAAAGLPPLRI